MDGANKMMAGASGTHHHRRRAFRRGRLRSAGDGGPNVNSPSPTPTAACPDAGSELRTDSNCVQYDGEAAMAANETYRQRRKLTPEMLAQLDAYVGPARKALDALTRPANADDVETAFAEVSLNEVQTDDGGNGVRFGVTVPSGGCLYGYVPLTGPTTVETGGSIMDDGCLEMFGH